tara:strand:+ start:1669 stop:1938 length:270 start_codon:yes stop_codon:yes gene_type:complete
MTKDKEIFDVNPLDPEVLQTHIHNQLVNIVHNIELQTDKLYDVYKENVPVSAVYPIRVKILEEKKYLNILIETLDKIREHKRLAKKAAN